MVSLVSRPHTGAQSLPSVPTAIGLAIKLIFVVRLSYNNDGLDGQTRYTHPTGSLTMIGWSQMWERDVATSGSSQSWSTSQWVGISDVGKPYVTAFVAAKDSTAVVDDSTEDYICLISDTSSFHSGSD